MKSWPNRKASSTRTRWALAWFEQYGMNEGPFGAAETLSKAKNTAVEGLEQAGILMSRGGKVRLLRREELNGNWDPLGDPRLTIWEVMQHLIRALDRSEQQAAELLNKVGSIGEVARDLAYRLYTICERKKWAQEALAYNSLVLVWPEITKLAGRARSQPQQMTIG
jgi:putative DNA methylase